MAEHSPEKKSGCGLLSAVFGRRSSKKSTTAGSVHNGSNNGGSTNHSVGTPNYKKRRNGSEENKFSEDQPSNNPPSSETQQKPNAKPSPQNHYHQQPVKQPPPVYGNHDQAVAVNNKPMNPSNGYVNQGRRVPRDAVGISGELESMIVDHQKSKGKNALVRASSGNVMLYGNLGNIRQPGGGGGGGGYGVFDYLPKPSREEQPSAQNTNYTHNNYSTNNKYSNYNSATGNTNNNVVNKKQIEERKQLQPAPSQEPASLCRALSTRMDPETLKIMGNEDYKNGNFAEALALYDAAISIDPHKASYRSNKSAALTALGRLLEAVFECREAIRMEPHYHRAHHRLANLYLRLGEVEKAIYHYKHAGQEADQFDIAKAKSVQAHLNKCTEAKKHRDWNTLIKETESAAAAGADSALQIFSLQAEALLKLHRHQEADAALKKGATFSVDDCTKFYGPIGSATLLVTQAQINLALGRFDDAMDAIQRAGRLDSNNREVNMVTRRIRAVASARAKGNDLFKAGRFPEACNAYGEGLDHDPYSSVLLCNRAACRSKLGQHEKAVEDCTAALTLRPGYSKARLRRADCYFKLEKWGLSIEDYEILQRESPEDESVSQALSEAKAELKKQRGGGA